MNYKIGFSKADITCHFIGVGMMGYGQGYNFIKENMTGQNVRAMVIKNNDENFVFLNLEICFITLALKEEVINVINKSHPELNLSYKNVLMTAQHTHAAAGGYSHFPFYNFTIPGFQLRVVDKIVSGCAEAIINAFKNLNEREINLLKGEVISEEIAFNRSMKAYEKNPECVTKDNHKAIERTMYQLECDDGMINWFGVHATSVSSRNNKIHFDNKGVAARIFEEKNKNKIGMFAQGIAGDVSPNFIWDKKQNRMRGKFVDQYESAEHNGELQFNEIKSLKPFLKIQGEIKSFHTFIDMEKLVVSPAHGVSFFEGAPDGLGIPKPLGNILRLMSRSLKKSRLMFTPRDHKDFYEAHGNKDIMLDHRTGEFVGMNQTIWKRFPNVPDVAVGNFIKQSKAGALNTLPWVPNVIAVQLVQIGELLILGVPGEITTMAGIRLKKMVENEVKNSGVKEIIISSYANCYMGYITTEEEYSVQCYEGGHNIYGKNTLKGIMTGFKTLCDMLKGDKNPYADVTPKVFPPFELLLRSVKS